MIDVSVPPIDTTTASNVIALAALGVALVSFAVLTYLTFIMLQFAAKPRLVMSMRWYCRWHPQAVQKSRFLPLDADITLQVHVRNAGHWYARPAVMSLTVIVNLDPQLRPSAVRYGSQLNKVVERF